MLENTFITFFIKSDWKRWLLWYIPSGTVVCYRQCKSFIGKKW